MTETPREMAFCDQFVLQTNSPRPLRIVAGMRNKSFVRQNNSHWPLRVLMRAWSSRPKERPLQPLTEPYVKLSFHTALVIRPESASHCSGQSSQLSVPWLLPQTSPNDATPSLHAHYSRFYTTTSGSAPAPCFDTLALRVLRFRLLS